MSGPTSNAPIKFIYDKSPLDSMDDDDEQPLKGNFVITGRLLPNSDLYREGSIEFQLVLGPQFPFMPPKAELAMPMFHPNVTKDGEVCIDLLTPNNQRWTAATSLVTVIEEVTKVIDQPSANLVQHIEAANLWDTNRSEYERLASELFRKHRMPR